MTSIFDSEGKELTLSEIIGKLPLLIELDNVNRVEVIDGDGRSYVNWKPGNKTKMSFQDNNRTLKIFVNNK